MNILGLWPLVVLAQGASGEERGVTEGEFGRLDPFLVVGSVDLAFEIPGSASYIDGTELSNFNYDNIDQVIRRVPGVYFRTEDGFGLFPNVSLRGVGSMRTSNVTVMEDGVLQAPAPYANPSAYYTPAAGRMSGVEMIKASSQVRYGPQITGGEVNYLSTGIPREREGSLRMLYGSERELRGHLWHGDRRRTARGTFGYVAEVFYRKTDGFKRIDEPGGGDLAGDSGFRRIEPMVKGFWVPNTDIYHYLEAKAGYTKMSANETYLGLTTGDFRVDPFRRYTATRFDRIDTRQYRFVLRHIMEPRDSVRLSTAAYYHDFSRSWYKLHDVNAGAGNRSLSRALGEPESGELAVLKGEGAGSFRVRANNRAYGSYGVQSFLQHEFTTGGMRHDLEVGVRLHKDYEDRFQHQDTYRQNGVGAITTIERGVPGSQDDRRGIARSLAVHVRNDISGAAWSLSPGLRYERIRYTDEDRRPGRGTGSDSLDALAYGIGLQRAGGKGQNLFFSWYRGFAVPSPGAVVNEGIREERSNALEMGYRLRDFDRGLRLEAILFQTGFRNLIVPDNIGGAGVGGGKTENIGQARTRGLELGVHYDFGSAFPLPVRAPAFLAFTYTDAELRNDVDAGGDGGAAVESIFAGGRRGAKLPHVPRTQISFGAGVESGRFGVYADGIYVDSTYGTASNTKDERRPDGTPDARFAVADAYFILDLSARYRLHERARLLLGANNALNRAYLASRLPHGPRPGQPRFLHAGLEIDF